MNRLLTGGAARKYSGKILPAQGEVSPADKARRMRRWNDDNMRLFGRIVKQVEPDIFRSKEKVGVLIPHTSNVPKNVKLLKVARGGHNDTLKPTMASSVKRIIFGKSNVMPSIIARNLRTFPMMSASVQKVDREHPTTASDKIVQNAGNVDYVSFPSVTKILDQTMSDAARAALERWRQEKIAELGEEGFQRYNRALLERGKMFHELLSQHFLATQGVSSVETSLEGVWNSVTPLLKNINNPKAIESHVAHPVLKYKGIIDCIAMYQDKPTLIEWKKSDKPKPTLSATFDNPVQLAAYFGAISHDTIYKGLNVRDALLVVAYTDGSPADAFHLNTDAMREHWAAWLTRLEKFWKSNEKTEDKENKSQTQPT